MRILVGFLRSPEGQAALERAIEETRHRGGELLVVHSSRGRHHDEADEVIAYREEFERLEQRLEGEGITYRVTQYVRDRSPAQDLLAAAEEHHADLIVIGVRRRSPVGKLVLGSNAQEILLQAHCDVLAVKPANGS